MRKILIAPLLILPLAAGAYLWIGGADRTPPSLAQAERYVAVNDAAQARQELARLLKQQPENGAAHLLQARVFLMLGDGVGAEAEIRRARTAGIATARTHHLLAQALLMQDQPQRALAEAMRATGPDAAQGLRIAGQARAATGDLPAALATLREAVARAPGDADILADLGRLQLAAGDTAGARSSALGALRAVPQNVDALLLSGEIESKAGNLKAALGWFDRAITASPGHIPATLAKAATLGDMGQSARSAALADAVLKRNPGNPMALYLKARLAADSHDYAAARDLIQQAGDRLDRNPAAMLLAGEVAHRLGNNELAIERLGRLLATDPGNARAAALLGAAQLDVGDALGAVATLQPLVDGGRADRATTALLAKAMKGARDKRADVYARRAGVPDARLVASRLVAADQAIQAGRWAEAARAYETLGKDLGDRDPLIANNLAWAYLNLGNGKAALAASTRAYGLAPDTVSVADTHGWILHATGADSAKAMSILEKAHAAAPANSMIAWHLAQVYAAQGRRAEARQLLTALATDARFPHKEAARTALSRL